MAEELGLGPQRNANLAKIEDTALLLLAQKIRRARKSGTLKSVLQQLNMLELLQKKEALHQNVWGTNSSHPL